MEFEIRECLFILNEYCLNRLAEGHSPKHIIKQFFDEFKEEKVGKSAITSYLRFFNM